MPSVQTKREAFTFKEGDSWPPFSFKITDENGDPVSMVGASILMQVRSKDGADILCEFTETIGFTIVSDVASLDWINAPRDIPIGTYQYDIQVTLSNGVVRTLYEGQVIIKKDTSH